MGTFSSVLKHRRRHARASADQLATSNKSMLETARDAKRKAREMWSAKMEKELTFNKDKRQKNFHDALSAGHLVEGEEYTPRDTARAKERRAKEIKAQETTTKRHARLQALMPAAKQQPMLGITVYVSRQVATKAELWSTMRRDHQATMTHAPTKAQVMVVPDPLQPPSLLHWTALVVGGTVASPLWAKSAGRRGTATMHPHSRAGYDPCIPNGWAQGVP